MKILLLAAQWHCPPNEVLDEPYDERLLDVAATWGVKPSRLTGVPLDLIEKQRYLTNVEQHYAKH